LRKINISLEHKDKNFSKILTGIQLVRRNRNFMRLKMRTRTKVTQSSLRRITKKLFVKTFFRLDDAIMGGSVHLHMGKMILFSMIITKKFHK